MGSTFLIRFLSVYFATNRKQLIIYLSGVDVIPDWVWPFSLNLSHLQIWLTRSDILPFGDLSRSLNIANTKKGAINSILSSNQITYDQVYFPFLFPFSFVFFFRLHVIASWDMRNLVLAPCLSRYLYDHGLGSWLSLFSHICFCTSFICTLFAHRAMYQLLTPKKKKESVLLWWEESDWERREDTPVLGGADALPIN